MNFSDIINSILYAFSGICFGIFASRYSVFSVQHIKSNYSKKNISCLFSCLPQLLFLITAFFLFPTWFISKTPTGGFFYYAVLAYFFNKGLRINNKK